MHFVVFGVLTGAGFLLAKAMRSSTIKARFLDMAQYRGEKEAGTHYVIVLDKDATADQKALAEQIKAEHPGAEIVAADEKTLAKVAEKLTGSAPKKPPKPPDQPDPLPKTEGNTVTMAVDPNDIRGAKAAK